MHHAGAAQAGAAAELGTGQPEILASHPQKRRRRRRVSGRRFAVYNEVRGHGFLLAPAGNGLLAGLIPILWRGRGKSKNGCAGRRWIERCKYVLCAPLRRYGAKSTTVLGS